MSGKKLELVHWEIFSGLCIVKSITDRYISVQFEEEYVLDIPDKMPKNYNSSGISGAPLITMVEAANGIYTWHLGCIIYEAQHHYGLMFASRSDFIMANGKIKKNYSLYHISIGEMLPSQYVVNI